MDDPGLTEVDQYFGDGFADRLTLGDGVEMTLALVAGAGREIGFAEDHRLTENRSGHRDGFVGSKCPNQRRRGVWTCREMAGELDPGLQLNHFDKRLEHFAEQLDLLLRVMAGSSREQIGNARKRPQLLIDRT